MSPLDIYYAQKDEINRLNIPWDIKRNMMGLFERPIHPTACAIKGFLHAWTKECKSWEIENDVSIFGAGNMPIVLRDCRDHLGKKIGVSKNVSYFTDILRDTIELGCPHFTKGHSRIMKDFYDICASYDNHIYELPAYQTMTSLLIELTA